MKKPILVIMAAGMGSRYGGLKQIDSIDEEGNAIMDYSIYDAKEAGFEDIVIIIKEENLEEFKHVIGSRLEDKIRIHYAFQDINDLPEGYEKPEERVKPWGTAHAIYSAKDYIDGPFVVINADDYYGREAFKLMYNFLSQTADDDLYRYAMVGYQLKNTVSETGYVSRGVCQLDQDDYLADIVERTQIKVDGAAIVYYDEAKDEWIELDQDQLVSMNMWGFSKSFIHEVGNGFAAFLDKSLLEDPLKGEYFLPFVVSALLKENKATVKVLRTREKWYGITYKEDKQGVVDALDRMKNEGKYPRQLWEA